MRHNALSPVPRTGPRILVADDDPLVRGSLAGSLMLHGYEAVTASDGDEAIQLYLQFQGRIDAVVLDLAMPKARGEFVLEMLRAAAPELPIVISSASWAREIAASRPAGEAEVASLIKPYPMERLIEALRRMVPTPPVPSA